MITHFTYQCPYVTSFKKKKDHEYSFNAKLRYNLSSFSGHIFHNGNDVRFHYYCHMPYESYHFWMQDLPLLVASGTSVHLLWWALPVVGFALCVWSKQIHMIHTHVLTDSRRWAPNVIATTDVFYSLMNKLHPEHIPHYWSHVLQLLHVHVRADPEHYGSLRADGCANDLDGECVMCVTVNDNEVIPSNFHFVPHT